MTKIKVAILLISPGKAGVESVVGNMLKYMDKERIELYLINSVEIAPYYTSFIPAERHLILGKYFSKPKNKYLMWAQRYIKYKLNINERKLNRWSGKVISFLDKHSVKILHGQMVWDFWIASKIREERLDIRYINTIHGTMSLDPADNYFPYFERQKVLKFLSNADATASACKYFIMLLELWKIPVKKYAVISNGIDPSVSQYSEPLRSENIIKICFMGGGRPHQKGGDILLYALSILIKTYKISNFKLLVFGYIDSDPKEKELAANFDIEKYIEWRGFVEPPHHLDGMRESDIFVLPSRHEGVANTLMEAIGMEMPIVASDVGGTSEVVTDGQNGLLCYPDARDLASKLALLINDPGLRQKFSEENRRRKQNYYWETICGEYADFYKQVYETTKT
jgi:glycosyltransferase involved in cell wall biosynthesis